MCACESALFDSQTFLIEMYWPLGWGARLTTHLTLMPIGRPPGSPLLWTSLPSRFVGIVGAMACPRPGVGWSPCLGRPGRSLALPRSPCSLALFHSHCHSPAESIVVNYSVKALTRTQPPHPLLLERPQKRHPPLPL